MTGAVARTNVNPVESIGTPFDAPATDITAENSAFSLLKGICAALGVPAGSGGGDVQDHAKLYADPVITLGNMTDAAAVDTGTHSAISFLKGIVAEMT